ncbi:hypothetical protein EV363DRAFT_1070828, partial [Boletus edulis]
LPPVLGAESRSLYSGIIGTRLHANLTHHDQESAIGKALWHQITTVVLLRDNLCQINKSIDDNRLCTALDNMCYKNCTKADLDYLQTCVIGPLNNHELLTTQEFRNVSIITAWNNQKDHINKLGMTHFAKDTGQKLISFYSDDQRLFEVELSDKHNKKKSNHKNTMTSSFEEQQVLWKASPHTSEHFAGCLKLYLGMPIIIRHNDATELCITNGQEAYVVGWTSLQGNHNQLILDTLFVELIRPPIDVQIDGLPNNVVPIPNTVKDILCTLPSDQTVYIQQQQVHVLPNFAMTDYASQGKTRQYNVVDLQHCQTHQSYYTALSRGTSSNGTAIIQGFDSSKITGGCSGWL